MKLETHLSRFSFHLRYKHVVATLIQNMEAELNIFTNYVFHRANKLQRYDIT